MSNILDTITKSAVKSAYSLSAHHQGCTYHAEHRVFDMELTHPSVKETLIDAKVSGTKQYTTSMRILDNKRYIKLEGKCSCPLERDCKHIVATLLHALDLNESMTANQPKANEIPKESPYVNQWLRQLRETMAMTSPALADQIDETYGLYYILSQISGKPYQLCVKPVLIRRLKTGGLGSEKKYSYTNANLQKHLRAIDKQVLTKLATLKSQSLYGEVTPFLLEGEYAELILPELLRTKRCYWNHVQGEPWSLAEPKSAELFWDIDTKGMQKLRFSGPVQHDRIIFIEHPWYFDHAQSLCGILNTNLDRNITKLLIASPEIPPDQVSTVLDFFTQHEQISGVAAPKKPAKKHLKSRKPIPCLRLFQTPIRSGYISFYSTEAESNKALMDLSFDYEGIIVPWHDSNESIYHIQDEQLLTLQRHQSAELKAMKTLLEHNAMVLKNIPEFAQSKFNLNYLHSLLIEHKTSNPLEFSINVLPLLREAGWKITFDENYPYQIIDEPIDDWYSSIREEASGNDWFGLELGITVKGEHINLLPVIQTLLKKWKSQNQLPPNNEEPVYAQLPNGHYVKLPAERIKNLLNVLIELYDADSLSDKQELRLSRLHASRLLEIEAALGAAELRWVGGDKIREMAHKLTNFRGITPAEVPNQFLAELRQYQHDGLNWLQFLREYEFGGILADDMGLGKTVQALAHITLEKTSGRMNQPCLVIAPTSLMFNWQKEASRFAPELKVLRLHGTERKEQFDNIANFDLILTTYPLIVRDKLILLKQHFHLLILDEAQFIKNAKSQAALVAMQLKASHRLCLTGTPMENHMGELWSLFHFMMPGLLGDQKSFQRLFRTPIEKHADQERRQHLNRRIAPFLLRRTKDKVVQELPAKVEMIRHVELEGGQRDLYETVRITMQDKIKKEVARLGLKRSHIIILDALLKLRQICCDPKLLKVSTAKQKASKSAKMELLMTLLPELIEDGRRVLLFSQFTEMLSIIEEAVTKAGIRYVKLTGQTKDRATPVEQFQAGEIPLFLISLKAGGTGLNLTAADTVIHYDPWWNPAAENQATDRAHRIGQEKTVFVYKLVAKGTVEEKILEMQQHKKQLMNGLFSDKTSSKLELTEQDLQGLFDKF